MPISSTLSNYAYASLDASRAASAQHLRDDQAAEQVRASLASQADTLKPGTTVTARYQYKVGADGTLTPTETQITTEANDADAVDRDGSNQQRSRNTLSQQSQNRQRSMADIAKPRAQMSPSDEMALFADATSDTDTAEISPTASPTKFLPIQGEAVAADGTKIDVEIITPGSQSVVNANTNQVRAQVLSLNNQAQSSVAALYARNNDIVYNVSPLAELAA